MTKVTKLNVTYFDNRVQTPLPGCLQSCKTCRKENKEGGGPKIFKRGIGGSIPPDPLGGVVIHTVTELPPAEKSSI